MTAKVRNDADSAFFLYFGCHDRALSVESTRYRRHTDGCVATLLAT
jgi:hypothetical protein